MTAITDDFMRQAIASTKGYTAVILRKGPDYNRSDAGQIIWEHARRNFSLRAEGLLSVVCPVNDGTSLAGIGIFNADMEQTKGIMDNDPGVQAGIFVYEMHATRSFPGDSLPK